MSVQDEINRINSGVSDAKSAIAEKGVEVPEGTRADDLGALIRSISAGGGAESVCFWDFKEGSSGATIRAYAVNIGGMVFYYAILDGSFSANAITSIFPGSGNTSEFTDLREAGKKFLPACTGGDETPTIDNFEYTYSTLLTPNIGANYVQQPSIVFTVTHSQCAVVLSYLTSGAITYGSRFVSLGYSQSLEQPSPAVSAALTASDLYPVNSIKMWYDNEDHSNFLGMTWERCLVGRFPVGIDPTQGEFASIGQQGGEKTHTLTTSEVPTLHERNLIASNGGSNARIDEYNENSAQPHNNLPPYETVSYWRRKA